MKCRHECVTSWGLTFGFIVLFMSCFFPVQTVHAETVIVDHGKSTFTVVMPAISPQSLQNAAAELQKDIQISTNANLRIVTDDQTVKGPFISLGLTKQAKAAGLGTEGMDDEEYRILTRTGNIYIWGIDTPDGKWDRLGGVSNGTANGIYVFLEKYLNVRWLMPGDIGRDIPRNDTFAVNDLDENATPLFVWRNMPHISYTKSDPLPGNYLVLVNQWAAHQRVDTYEVNHSAMRFGNEDFNHNWTKTVPANLFEEHPEWFAMRSGKRRPPTGRYMLETTNQELVRYFAEKAISALKASDRPRSYSLSPSDKSSWSRSPESMALYDPVPPGRERPSVSPLILKWYHDVAEIVQKEYPQGRLAGYLYGDYLFPPVNSSMKFPDNFTPVIAPSIDYGYRLFRDDVQEQFASIMSSWAKVAPQYWFYYDLPNQLYTDDTNGEKSFTGNTANVTPAAPEILNLIFHQMVKSHIRGAMIYADPTWSNSALANYIIAKMMWDPTLDAYELQREWLYRAYGDKAGEKMELFYNKLDSIFKEGYSKDHSLGSHLNQTILRDVYAAHYAELETLFLDALRQPMTPTQKKRLGMIEDNLILLQWRLRNARLWKEGQPSQLYRTDQQIADILEAKHDEIDYFPGVIPRPKSKEVILLEKQKIQQIQLTPDQPAQILSFNADSSSVLPKENIYRISVTEDSKVHVLPVSVDHASTFATYVVFNSQKETVTSGLLVKDRPIEFAARAGQAYYLYVTARNGIGYQLSLRAHPNRH